MAIALLGGSFNPPHRGHTDVCRWLVGEAGLKEVWLIPTYLHPFNKDLVPFEHRVAMCEVAIQSLGQRARVCRIEKDLGGVSYTVRTLEALKGRFPQESFEWVVGSDLIQEMPSWRDVDRLRDLVQIRPVLRSGWPLAEPAGSPEFPEISSQEIRTKLAQNEPVGDLIFPEVLEYIRTHDFYSQEGEFKTP